MRYYCWTCHKSVTSELPEDSVIRGVLTCPECVEKEKVVFPEKNNNKKKQRYQLKFTRREDGKWQVIGYWEIEHSKWSIDVWDLDGAPLVFNTREEACSHIANMTGIPD